MSHGQKKSCDYMSHGQTKSCDYMSHGQTKSCDYMSHGRTNKVNVVIRRYYYICMCMKNKLYNTMYNK
jgi:hypothetical protein